jgi:ribosomal protein L11 methyltransferase
VNDVKWWEVRFIVPSEASEAVAALLHEWPEVHGVTMEGVTGEEPMHPEWGEWFDESLLHTDDVTMSAYVPETVGREEIEDRVKAVLNRVRDAELSIGQAIDTLDIHLIDETSWEDAWKKEYKPIVVGKKFVIVPKWELEHFDIGNRLAIILEPGMAFGTGSHATTQLCLEALEDIDVTEKRVLDIGCGTAVLAIGAAKAGAKQVTAIDIDPVAVSVASGNVRDNGVENCVSVVEGDLLSRIEDDLYDLAFANILRDIVVALCPQAATRIRVGGYLITSGFVDSQQEAVLTALRENGFELRKTYQREDWVALVAERVR